MNNTDIKPYLLAAVLCACAWYIGRTSAPKPDEMPTSGLNLRGQFIGPDAARDAASFSAMCDELGVELELDGKRNQPWITTGMQVEELRSRVREGMMHGESMGARQPHVKKLVGDYMTAKLGVDPGPLKNRDAWVATFKEIARESARAAR